MTQLEWPLVREVSIYYELELIRLEIKFNYPRHFQAGHLFSVAWRRHPTYWSFSGWV